MLANALQELLHKLIRNAKKIRCEQHWILNNSESLTEELDSLIDIPYIARPTWDLSTLYTIIPH